MAFAKVMIKLTKQLLKNSLNLKSPVIKISNAKCSTLLPKIIYIKSIEKLSNLNFINDDLKESDINKAFLAYQKSKQSPLTGLPEQYTLWNLLAE
ncbi:MAG: hypothetical protein QNK36_15955 [Colwellia sp.]|nr:hypothetical protein [Colwellia sp.]